ncbi:hypothetical protein [Aeromonas salmonicida]|uniref:Flagellar protein FliT n=1 Tax=Aeromonas salmonicida TaxID=645 RepID=A0AAX3VWJ0_AERSA|nr:hypothetical protein [Aeromonas salmonicida]RSM27236.1 hypothetical protein C5B77_16840 [Aeromonas salmonicida]WHF37879.1 hypothetical protein QLQ87_05895 [Aeromonas salmonicida]
MSDAQHLLHLSKLLEAAIKSQDLQSAHELVDQRLVLLDGIYHSERYSQELVNAANVILENEQILKKIILDEKNEIKKKLLSVIASDKASQLYKSHSKK